MRPAVVISALGFAAAGALAWVAGAQPASPGALPSASAASAAPGGSSAAPAAGGSEGCVKSFGDAQRLAREGKLKARRAELIVCAQASCPAIISAKCSEWLQDADKTQPSILLVVTDGKGGDVVDIEITIDGQPVARELVGRALEIDPGTHEIEVKSASLGTSAKKSVVVSEGEKGRRVEVTFAPKPGPGAAVVASDDKGALARVHPVTWVGFTVAVAGAIAGGVTGGLALARSSELEEACGGTTCSPAQRELYDEGLILAHASTASLAVAGAGALLGVITLPLLYQSKKAPVPGRNAPAARVRAQIGPTFVGVGGAF